MKRWLPFILIACAAVAALVYNERHKTDADASPRSILYAVADTGREITRAPARFTRMTDEEEIRIGNELAQRYSVGLSSKDVQVESFIQSVGRKIFPTAHRKLPYQFHYLPDPNMVNAFALPGGHVFVGGGLLHFMDTEDQLAAVLGHEIEHIDQYHCAERVQLEANARKWHLGDVGALANIPITLFQVGYSKKQELAADQEGARLAVLAGYSPIGAIRLFEKFQKMEDEHTRHPNDPAQELTGLAWQTLSGYFESHPLPSERIQQVRAMINDSSDPRWRKLNETPIPAAVVAAQAR
jgi:predicted Zn-dependent protease